MDMAPLVISNLVMLKTRLPPEGLGRETVVFHAAVVEVSLESTLLPGPPPTLNDTSPTVVREMLMW